MEDLNPDQEPDNWGAIALDYEQAFEGLSGQYAAHALRLLDLPADARVLDVAAGTGAFSLLAARGGAEVLAVDFAPGMVARLRERGTAEGHANLTAALMDGQALDLPDASFDAAASVLGLIFFPDLDRGLSELRRVLRAGGKAAVVAWHDPAHLPLMALVRTALAQVVPDFRLPPATPTWARLAGPDALRSRMAQAGFKHVAVVPSTAIQRIESPESYWEGFTRSAPPLAHLFARLGPERTAAVGRAYVEALRGQSEDGVPTLVVEACIGLGTA